MSLLKNVKLIPEIKGKVREVPKIDETLTKDGWGADAKVTGEELKKCNKSIDDLYGHGLGSYAKGLENINLDDVTKAGYYCYDANTGVANKPVAMPSILHVKPFYNGDYVEQEVTLLDGKGTKIKRVRHAGTWMPWEYENPPMETWEEYRTTERFAGKPVYTKRITTSLPTDIGNSGGAYNFAIEFSTPNVDQFVRYGGTIETKGADGWPSTNPLPFFNDNGGFMGANYLNNGGLAMHIEKHIVPANTPINIQIWYTKLSD